MKKIEIGECKYCCQRFNEEIYRNDKEMVCMGFTGYYAGRYTKSASLYLRFIDINGKLFSPHIKVNYCPMCGRKLKIEDSRL